ncbi:glycosyltransferase [Candidatus Falkowbacteria bacterium]|jgi:glycosyltransferase involved in cell wall biosynthesis|nr:glycosyltransferase [Candidatus Falkowbacteria bacterium]MBT4433363.1 glycosyltransferase [Candidatus Falkowbacteria bacterium]
MSKKVLIFSLAYPPFVGGAELAIKEETDRIKDIEFDMVTLRFDRDLPKFERVGNVNVYRIGFTKPGAKMEDLVKYPLKLNKLIFPFIACFKASKLHKKNKYDAIWAMMAAYAGFAAMFFKTRHPKVPYLLTLQEGDPIDYILKKVRFVKPLFKRIFTKADYLQAISNYLASWGKGMGFKGELKLVPNAVNTAHFSQEYNEEELNELKKELGKKDNDKYVITTSRLVLKNAVDDVIKSLQYLPDNIKFLVLGDGPDKEKLDKLVEKLKVKDRVKFLGLVDHKVMPKYLKASDIFIRASLSEGFGNSFIEAMAAEIPVIATQEGGIADFLFDSEKNPNKKSTGWAVNKRDPKGIAQAIKKILDNQEQTKKTVENAKKMAFEKYDWNIIAKDMEGIFKKITKK